MPNQFYIAALDSFINREFDISRMPKKEDQIKDLSFILKKPPVEAPFLDFLKSKFASNKALDNTLLGVEVEVEGIYTPVDFPYMWEHKQDGSLRNNGIEYVTFPTPSCYIPALLAELQEGLVEYNKPVYSSRTSIHVHMNVLDLTVEQLKSFVLLYLCFEKALFEYVGGDREKSIFCIPLVHAGYVGNLKYLFSMEDENRYQLKDLAGSWHKYTSLNLKTINSFGTVEFRHMSGTNDIKKLIGWLQLILSLRSFALTCSKEKLYALIEYLNSTSEYEAFACSVFKDTRELLTPFLQVAMEDNITFIKDCFEEIDKYSFNKEAFEKSSFVSNHNIKFPEVTEEEKYLRSLSVEQLQKELTGLAKAYEKAIKVEERRKVESLYIKIRDILIEKGEF